MGSSEKEPGGLVSIIKVEGVKFRETHLNDVGGVRMYSEFIVHKKKKNQDAQNQDYTLLSLINQEQLPKNAAVKIEPTIKEEDDDEDSFEYGPLTTIIKIEPQRFHAAEHLRMYDSFLIEGEGATEFPKVKLKDLYKPILRIHKLSEETVNRWRKRKFPVQESRVDVEVVKKLSCAMAHPTYKSSTKNYFANTGKDDKVQKKRSCVSKKQYFPNKCDQCSKSFRKKKDLKTHSLKAHYKGKLFACKECGNVVKSSQAMYNHKLSHNPKKSSCDICKKIFMSQHAKGAHWKKKHFATHGSVINWRVKNDVLKFKNSVRQLKHKGPYTCDLCGFVCKNRPSACHHMLYRHTLKPYLFCDFCPGSFNRKLCLLSHLRSYHLKKKAYNCKICGYSAARPDQLKDHNKIHQKTKIECPVCQIMVFALPRHLRWHKLYEKEKNIPCRICGRIVNSKKSLKTHLKQHQKELKCKQCEKVFYGSGSLMSHNLEVHCKRPLKLPHAGIRNQNKSSARGIRCWVCDLKLPNLVSYRVHWDAKHSEVQGDFNESKISKKDVFACDLCGFVSKDQEGLERHFKTKRLNCARKVTFSCDLCPASFITKWMLYVHFLRATTEDGMEGLHIENKDFKSFNCFICKFSADNHVSLKQHFKEKHRKRTEGLWSSKKQDNMSEITRL